MIGSVANQKKGGLAMNCQCVNGISDYLKYNPKKIGRFKISEMTIDVVFEFLNRRWARKNRGCYAITANEKIVYIGSTSDSFEGRIYSYLTGNKKHDKNNSNTNSRMYGCIAKELLENKNVEFYCFPSVGQKTSREYFGNTFELVVDDSKEMEYAFVHLFWTLNNKTLPKLNSRYGIVKWFRQLFGEKCQ